MKYDISEEDLEKFVESIAKVFPKLFSDIFCRRTMRELSVEDKEETKIFVREILDFARELEQLKYESLSLKEKPIVLLGRSMNSFTR